MPCLLQEQDPRQPRVLCLPLQQAGERMTVSQGKARSIVETNENIKKKIHIMKIVYRIRSIKLTIKFVYW